MHYDSDVADDVAAEVERLRPDRGVRTTPAINELARARHVTSGPRSAVPSAHCPPGTARRCHRRRPSTPWITMIVDANILLYAIDLSSPFHQRAARENEIPSTTPGGLPWRAIGAFLRISTIRLNRVAAVDRRRSFVEIGSPGDGVDPADRRWCCVNSSPTSRPPRAGCTTGSAGHRAQGYRSSPTTATSAPSPAVSGSIR